MLKKRTLLAYNEKTGSEIPHRFTRLYVLTLSLLALLLTAGQLLTQWRIGAMYDQIGVIKYAALQRHQSQQIVQKALRLADEPLHRNRVNQAELAGIFGLFERYHGQVRAGRVPERPITVPNSDTVQGLYAAVQPHFEGLCAGTRSLLHAGTVIDSTRQAAMMQAGLRVILAHEKPFLQNMDAIVQQYNAELRLKLNQLRLIEFYLYVATVVVLLGIGRIIFRPAVRRLRHTIARVVRAERRTAAANKKLVTVNRALKNARRELQEATRQQYQQEIDEQQLRTAYAISGQEEERKRLSRELHDGLGQMLTAIKLQVEGLEASLNGSSMGEAAPAVRRLGPLKQLITQTIQETRSISNNLMPSVLNDFGLVPALKALADGNGHDATVDVSLTTNLPTGRLAKNVEVMLYRITQEAVNNALRHAHPTRIGIDLFAKDEHLHLIIADDGRGFRPRQTGPPTGQGLHNMHERAKLLNGKFKITSVPGKGTKIQVSVPDQLQQKTYESNKINARG